MEGLLKVTTRASHVHSKCGNISETVPGRVVAMLVQTTNRKWYNGPSNRDNSDDLETHLRSFSLQGFQVLFLYRCEAVDKISSDVVRRAVPLQ